MLFPGMMSKLGLMLNAALLIAGIGFLSGCDDSTGVVVDVCFVISDPPGCRCYPAEGGDSYFLKISSCDGYTTFSPSDAEQIYDRLIQCKQNEK